MVDLVITFTVTVICFSVALIIHLKLRQTIRIEAVIVEEIKVQSLLNDSRLLVLEFEDSGKKRRIYSGGIHLSQKTFPKVGDKVNIYKYSTKRKVKYIGKDAYLFAIIFCALGLWTLWGTIYILLVR